MGDYGWSGNFGTSQDSVAVEDSREVLEWGTLIPLIFFLQLCRYHPFCHYFCGTRGAGYFLSIRVHRSFLLIFALFLLKSRTRGFFVLARVCPSCAGVNIYTYIHHHMCHRNSGKMDDTDRAEERK